MPLSKLDQVYRSILLTRFFNRGWGKPENLKRLFEFRKLAMNREKCQALVDDDHPIYIVKDEVRKSYRLIEGHFTSPFVQHMPGVLPVESELAHFQMILPLQWRSNLRPICLHLAGTGDHYFFRRRNLMCRPLLKETGIASIILENPFYGLRKPKDQVRSNLHNVSDIFVMGGCLILETMALFRWCERNGFGPLGITGVSMGGHMASIAATNWPKPVVLIPCLSWSTASGVFTKGVLSSSINWDLLEKQYCADEVYREEIRKMVTALAEDDAFKAGQHFAKTYPMSLDRMHEIRLEDDVNSTDIFSAVTQISSGIADDTITSSKEEKKRKETFGLVYEFAKSKSKILTQRNKSGSATIVERHNQEEALQFMRGIMDDCTHLANYSIPVDTSLIIAVAANDDAYVPRDGVTDLTDIWPGIEVRYLDAGHISAFLLHQDKFRTAIKDGFDRIVKKYYTNE